MPGSVDLGMVTAWSPAVYRYADGMAGPSPAMTLTDQRLRMDFSHPDYALTVAVSALHRVGTVEVRRVQRVGRRGDGAVRVGDRSAVVVVRLWRR